MNNESQIQKDHPVKLRSFDTHSHSLREDGQGPPKSERLSILTPFPNQALSEVLKVPSALTSSEHSFGKNLPRTSSPAPPWLHQRNAKTCENRQNWLQHPESGYFRLDLKIQEGPSFICIKKYLPFFFLLKGCNVFCGITINNTM